MLKLARWLNSAKTTLQILSVVIRDFTKYNSNLHQSFQKFWSQYPALYYGLSLLLGVYTSLAYSPGLLAIVILFFLFSLSSLGKTLSSLLLFISAFFYSNWVNHYPNLPESGIKGSALFDVSALTHQNSFMGKSWKYSGKIIQFISKDHETKEFFNIPATVYLKDEESIQRAPADHAYILTGRLKKTAHDKYVLYPEKKQSWQQLANTWSFAEWRFKAKNAVNRYIQQRITSEPSRSFLSGIATGEFENRLLAYEFSRFGLQHIMAISGFHFSIVASILSFFLSMIIGRKSALIVLMLIMTSYFIFLGHSPSIVRAWISCMIAFAACLFEKVPTGLNSLGIGLLIVLILDPELTRHIGFQFSFAVTAAILLFYSPLNDYLEVIFPKKTIGKVFAMNRMNQHGFIILALFRQALALTLAVNLAAIPITLFYFQKFPLMSILYNFFFPGMISISMLLLIIGLSFDLLHPYLGGLFHHMNEYFTQFMLDYTYTFPRHLDINLHLSLNQEIVILWLALYFLTGIYLHSRCNSEKVHLR